MNCHRIMNLMSAYVDGELTGAEMLEIRRHLAECEECAEEYEAVRFTKMAVARLGNVTPRKDFAADIMKQLDEVYVPSHQRFANALIGFLRGKFSPVAAALAASGLALVILSAGGVQEPMQVNDNAVAVNSPYEVGVRDMTLPGSPVAIPTGQPLPVAETSGPTFEFASLAVN